MKGRSLCLIPEITERRYEILKFLEIPRRPKEIREKFGETYYLQLSLLRRYLLVRAETRTSPKNPKYHHIVYILTPFGRKLLELIEEVVV